MPVNDPTIGIQTATVIKFLPTEVQEELAKNPLVKKVGNAGISLNTDDIEKKTKELLELIKLIGFENTSIMASGINQSRAEKISLLQDEFIKLWAARGGIAPNPFHSSDFGFIFQLKDLSGGYPKGAEASMKKLLRALYV